MITTTLDEIRMHEPCIDGWKKLCKNLGGIKKYGENTPITFQQIYKSNGHDDTLWCLRATDEKYHYLWRHFAVDCAKQVEHLMGDERSKNALVVARKYADGKATEGELSAACDAARDAAWDAARDAAWDAAGDAAGDAARDAAWAAEWAAEWAAVNAAQVRLLFDYCSLGERPKDSVERLAKYIKEEK